MPLRPSGPMWERHLLSGSPALCTMLSFPFHWQNVGTKQLQLQSGANKGPGQSIKAAPCQILLPVSQAPLCHWWEVSHLLWCAWVRQGNQETAKPLRWQPLDCGEDPLRLTPLKMAPETCHHLPRTEEELIQMGIPQQVRHLVSIIAEGGSKVRKVLHPHVWTCQFLNQLTLMRM